jgi:hypothetical protein
MNEQYRTPGARKRTGDSGGGRGCFIAIGVPAVALVIAFLLAL